MLLNDKGVGLVDLAILSPRSCFLYSWVSSSLGIIEHRDRPHSPIQYFTQEDINQGKIMYRPPAAAPHLQEIMAYSFVGNAFFFLCLEAPKSFLIFMAGSSLSKTYIQFVNTLFFLLNINWSLSASLWLGSGLSSFTANSHRRRTFSQLWFSGSGMSVTSWGVGDTVETKTSHWPCS